MRTCTWSEWKAELPHLIPLQAIFLLTRYAGVGKDTFEKWLCESYKNEYTFYVVHFADPLKEMCTDLVQMIHQKVLKRPLEQMPTLDSFHDPVKKQQNFYEDCPGWNPRVCMQWVGTDWMRYYDPLFWSRQLPKHIEKVEEWYKGKETMGWIVPDWRFINEWEELRRFYPNRPIIRLRLERDNHTPHTVHSSEVPIPNEHIDYTVKLPGTLDEF